MTWPRSRMRTNLGLALGGAVAFGGLAAMAGGLATVALGAPKPAAAKPAAAVAKPAAPPAQNPPEPAPEPPPAPTWADWVGDYTGKLAWRGCAVTGEASATVAIDAVDAVVSIDLAKLGAGFRTMSLASDRDDLGWSGQQGDLRVSVARVKTAAAATTASTIDLDIELDSGCTVRGRFAKAGTGVAACDQLVGWGRIEARCDKLAVRGIKRLEDPAELAKARWRPADAERCAARAERLELSLITNGCAPHPDRAIGTRAHACLELVDVTARVARCKALPPDREAQWVRLAGALSAAAQSADPATTLADLEEQCREAKAALDAIAARLRCPV